MQQLDDKRQLWRTFKKKENLTGEPEKSRKDNVNKHKAKLCLEDAKSGYTLHITGVSTGSHLYTRSCVSTCTHIHTNTPLKKQKITLSRLNLQLKWTYKNGRRANLVNTLWCTFRNIHVEWKNEAIRTRENPTHDQNNKSNILTIIAEDYLKPYAHKLQLITRFLQSTPRVRSYYSFSLEGIQI